MTKLAQIKLECVVLPSCTILKSGLCVYVMCGPPPVTGLLLPALPLVY